MTDLEALLEDIRARLHHYKEGILNADESLAYIEMDIQAYDAKQETK